MVLRKKGLAPEKEQKKGYDIHAESEEGQAQGENNCDKKGKR